jgi:hypothetical protein
MGDRDKRETRQAVGGGETWKRDEDRNSGSERQKNRGRNSPIFL